MSKSKLQRAIISVNNRYAKGLNDDDQVARMVKIARETKGYYFLPMWDEYELCTDLEFLIHIDNKYGYWSKEVLNFNEVLKRKGDYNYMVKLNDELRAYKRTVVNN